jgi:hypothetical protein
MASEEKFEVSFRTDLTKHSAPLESDAKAKNGKDRDDNARDDVHEASAYP